MEGMSKSVAFGHIGGDTVFWIHVSPTPQNHSAVKNINLGILPLASSPLQPHQIKEAQVQPTLLGRKGLPAELPQEPDHNH